MFKVGKYIACWKRPYYLNSICGCVTDAKEIDENRVSYTIKTSNGGTAEIIYTGKNWYVSENRFKYDGVEHQFLITSLNPINKNNQKRFFQQYDYK